MKFKRVVSSVAKSLRTVDDVPVSVRELIAEGFTAETALCMHDESAGIVYILAVRKGEEVWLKLKYN